MMESPHPGLQIILLQQPIYMNNSEKYTLNYFWAWSGWNNLFKFSRGGLKAGYSILWGKGNDFFLYLDGGYMGVFSL